LGLAGLLRRLISTATVDRRRRVAGAELGFILRAEDYDKVVWNPCFLLKESSPLILASSNIEDLVALILLWGFEIGHKLNCLSQ
jgi:hypothetical protein